MVKNKSLRKYRCLLFVALTVVFLIYAIFLVQRGCRDFHRDNSDSLSYIAALLEDSLAHGNSLSMEMTTQSDILAMSRESTLQGVAMLSLQNIASGFRFTTEINNMVESIYVYFLRSQKVLTRETLYPFDSFYEKDLLEQYLQDGRAVWYTCRRSGSDDASYIQPSNVLTMFHPLPLDAENPDAVIIVNLNINRILTGFSHYERIALTYGDTVVGANGSETQTGDLQALLTERRFSGDQGRTSLPQDTVYYQRLADTDIYCTILVAKTQLLTALLPNLSILAFTYIISLLASGTLLYAFSRLVSRRSQYLIEQIGDGTGGALASQADAFQSLDDAIHHLVSSNRLLLENEKKYRFLVQNLVITDIILGNIGSIDDMEQRLAYCGLKFEYPNFTGLVCVPSIDDSVLLADAAAAYGVILFIKELISSELSKDFDVYTALSLDNKIYFFINHSISYDTLNTLLKSLLHKIDVQAQNDYDISLFFSTGPCVHALADVAKSCHIANKLSDTRNMSETEEIISHISSQDVSPAFPSNISDRILSGFKKNSRDDVLRSVSAYFDDYLIPGGFNLELCINITSLLVANLVGELWSHNWNIRVEETLSYIASLSQQKTLEELRSKMCSIMELVFDLQPNQPVSEKEYSDKYIPTVIDYINNNYFKDLTIADIASCVDLNPRYLGELFKEATGKTLVKYLNTVRISRSKQLLTETTATIKDIAAKIGYNDIHAFIRHFKAMNYGMTPSEYRESH